MNANFFCILREGLCNYKHIYKVLLLLIQSTTITNQSTTTTNQSTTSIKDKLSILHYAKTLHSFYNKGPLSDKYLKSSKEQLLSHSNSLNKIIMNTKT